MNRQTQMWILEDQRRYNEDREKYLRDWAREILIDTYGSLKNCRTDLSTFTVEELQDWYDETHQ